MTTTSHRSSSTPRVDGRAHDATRPVSIETAPLKYAEGSALITFGDTRVLVAASIENRVPPFLIGTGKGWLTAEYAMLPRATVTRSPREVTKGRPTGRSSEIQRLIGRSLRAALDLEALPERTLTIDCDVLQADGGTRTAAITGAWVATVLACAKVYLQGDIARWPVRDQVAAISAGWVAGHPLLDLDAPEDQSAEIDMNVIGTASGHLVEVQGTGERRVFSRQELDVLIDLAFRGIAHLATVQSGAVAEVLAQVASAGQRAGARGSGSRGVGKGREPKSEESLWGPP